MIFAKLFVAVLACMILLPILSLIIRGIRKSWQAHMYAEAQRERELALQKAAEAKAAEQAEAQRIAQEKKAAAAEARKAKQAEAKAKAKAREDERVRKAAERIEAARQIAELNERALIAARELKALDHGNAAETIHPAQATDAAPQEQPRKLLDIELPQNGECPKMLYDLMAGHADAPKPFAGQTVAFTGKLPGMTRKEAIALVESLGGRAFSTMPAGTTLLVVGDKPGMGKMDKADQWIGQVKKITAERFMDMAHAAQ